MGIDSRITVGGKGKGIQRLVKTDGTASPTATPSISSINGGKGSISSS
jgi:hypothetical protein